METPVGGLIVVNTPVEGLIMKETPLGGAVEISVPDEGLKIVNRMNSYPVDKIVEVPQSYEIKDQIVDPTGGRMGPPEITCGAQGSWEGEQIVEAPVPLEVVVPFYFFLRSPRPLRMARTSRFPTPCRRSSTA
jgi:hypothetical protein